MSSEDSSTAGSCVRQSKRRPKTILTRDAKLEIIQRLERGETAASLGRTFKVNESTIRTIRKNAAKITSAVARPETSTGQRVTRNRNSALERTENLLITWYRDQQQQGVTESVVTMRHKALELYQGVIHDDAYKSLKFGAFQASVGWLKNFCKRYNVGKIETGKRKLENGSTGDKESSARKKTNIVQNADDEPEQIFVPKSSTERVRIHREKKRSEEMANKPPKKPPKTGLQRAREYRARRKAALNADVTALAPAQDLTWPMVENDGPSTNAEESRSDEDCSTGEFVRTKWRSLRDYYRHEQRKVQSTKYGSVHKSSWKHYGHMQFLRGTVQRHRWPVQLPSSQGEYVDQLSSADASSQGDVDQPPLANVSFPEDYEPVEPVVKLEYDEDDTEKAMVRIGTPISLATNQQLQIEAGDNQTLDDDSFQKAPSEQHFSLVQFPPTTPQNSLRVRETANKRPASETDPLDFERRKFIVLEKLVLENEDDDLQFFKSLIPDVKNLPRAKKAHLRLRIQQLIVDEIYGNETITNGSEECKMNDT